MNQNHRNQQNNSVVISCRYHLSHGRGRQTADFVDFLCTHAITIQVCLLDSTDVFEMPVGLLIRLCCCLFKLCDEDNDREREAVYNRPYQRGRVDITPEHP
ncbi:hypothetical protein HW555_001393 [Spodoptera exigua]|uniref:Uncharacterized protein n=1 Tax=Spodoptera exigua TaxID=7107 RepID=A0A835L8W1_SPOEX|nr:hypothetical protein HW555_001393 [Spodoptera exigua]